MFKQYSSYQDTELEWLGDIPATWKLRKAKWIFYEKSVKGFPNETLLSVSKGKGVIPRDQLEFNTVMAFKDLENFKLVIEKEFVIHLRSFQSGFEMSLNRGIVSPAYTVFSGNIDTHSNYYKYLFYMQSFIDAIASTTQSLRDGKPIAFTEFSKMELPLPSIEEQRKIGDFLDSTLQNLDKCIGIKQKLITLLEEHRQSIITEAVTKGINTNVKMKDSGVEWIGEIPDHWEMKKLKYIGEAVTGLTYSPEDLTDESGTIVLRSTNIQKRKISVHDNVYVKKEIPNKLLTRKNDILICSRNGSRNLIGKNAFIEDEIDLSFGAFTTVFRSEFNDFIYFVLNSNFFEAQLGTYLTSTINQLTISNLNNMDIMLPPRNEQLEIVSFLRGIMNNYDELEFKIENQIEKLKEYRQALIYEAVTGKIDVRDMELD